MVRVGIVGTSWWADSMYLPALQNHPHGEVVAVAARNPERTAAFAQKWNIPQHFSDWQAMIASGLIDALIVSTPNTEHYPITMAALDAGLHVLCEKPMALDHGQARAMAQKAEAVGVKHMIAFTHRWLPTMRYIKHLLDDGYIGDAYHLNMRWYSGGGRRSEYYWRGDASVPGSGVLADLGSHYLHYARWFFGEVMAVRCSLRPLTRRDYPTADEVASIDLQFTNGALGALMVSMVAYEGDGRMTQSMEFHGAGGTLYYHNDWQTVQRISGLQPGQGKQQALTVPDSFWNGARHDTVDNTMHDVYNTQDSMARAFVTDIAEDRPCMPDFHEGARVQQLQDAAAESAGSGGWVAV